MNPDNNKGLIRLMEELIMASTHRSMASSFQFGKQNNLSFSQMSILHRLYKKGPATVSEISAMLDISKSAVSQLIDKMVNQSLVSRKENPDDRRIRFHSLTEQGRRIMNESMIARVSWIKPLKEKISGNEAALITEALTILNNKINELEPIHPHKINKCKE